MTIVNYGKDMCLIPLTRDSLRQRAIYLRNSLGVDYSQPEARIEYQNNRVERTVEDAKRIVGIVMQRAGEWMTVHDFSLALEKTMVIILTKKTVPILHSIIILQIEESKPMVEYLGLTLDSKAGVGISALIRVVDNVGAPTFSKNLLMSGMQSVLIYNGRA